MTATASESLQEVQEIVITGTKNGLGIVIVGGINMLSNEEAEFGIFIKDVIKGSLAFRDGRLKRGDQLISANEKKLIGMKNEEAIGTLKTLAKTGTIKFTVSRSPQSQDEFRRLSTSLLREPLLAGNKGVAKPQLNPPVATSTPRASDIQPQPAGIRASGFSDGTATTNNTRPSSASSNFTNVSTTDMETDDDIDKPVDMQQERVASPASTEAALSDVVVTMDDAGTRARLNSGGPPPPLPSSPPPMFDEEHVVQRGVQRSQSQSSEPQMSRVTPEGKSISPPDSATLGPTGSHSFIINKGSGLGIVISGGVNRQDGPNIYIEKILDGMDAAKDGQLRKGDRIISVNGVLFANMTREKALTTLTQLKLRQTVKAYTISIERPAGSVLFPPSTLPSLSLPTRDPSSIFDSDTLTSGDPRLQTTEFMGSSPLVPESYFKLSRSEHLPGATEVRRHDSSKKSTPQRYLAKKSSLGHADTNYDSLHKRLSMEPSARVKLAKLEWALTYMGYNISPANQEQIRANLDISEDGKVVFADFVNLAKELFAFKLDDAHLEANLVYALTQKDSLDMPPMPRKATSVDQLAMEYSPLSSQMKLAASQPVLTEPSHETELDQMRQKLHDIGEQRERLKLSDSDVIRGNLMNRHKNLDIDKVRAKSPSHEGESSVSISSEDANAVMRKRVGLAEAAAKASREKANQLEDSMRQVEAELTVLREQQANRNAGAVSTDQLAALDCELRKEKATTRRFQVATERLLQFVENCHEALVKSPDADRILYHPHGQGQSVARGDPVTGNPRPPQYLSRHAKVTATTLSQEAKETIAAVQKLLQTDTLPFAWDIAYTEDGQKYYINHETKTTSWSHPVTKVNASHGTRASTPSSQSSYQP